MIILFRRTVLNEHPTQISTKEILDRETQDCKGGMKFITIRLHLLNYNLVYKPGSQYKCL